ncbi:1-deoxy-D-xylulose-5-phosphate reductoisomerase [uncultured Veillonella sp.]|uniref:1-deoxy-D-xylulose-5-phosphate reductoisomerase n=1 Tax=uncultured Veillonella sp. TaxID=159268 RepID=UPI0025D486E0|nr:1-deoxy-D-xylulose-5-phosphate reductoisomerase [uncultured Veillonella sp.]
MKYVSILGSTGSIGTQTLDVIRQHPNQFKAVALVANKNIDLLESQINEFRPLIAGVVDEKAYTILKERYKGPTKLIGSKEALIAASTIQEATMVITAIVGAVGIEPTVKAIKAQKTIGLANKETLVAGGPLITSLAKAYNVPILPIDSEHSAIFQCLEGQNKSNVDSLILTASGGPLRTWSSERIASATAEDCLKHPTWNMGSKITIDSASLFNKGLEVIEAHWLFDFDFDHIDVVVHPQSIIHSMIRLNDGAILAQMGNPDMREPIQYALTYPKRMSLNMKHLDFKELLTLEFMPPRVDDFPALNLAYKVGKIGGFKPAVFNAANETAVYAFLDGKIVFSDIYKIVTAVLASMETDDEFTLDNLLAIDQWARIKALEFINRR